MASDDKGKGIKETITDEVKGIVVEVYKDAAKPGVSEIGKTVALAVAVGLAPVNIILSGAKVALDRLRAAVERKLSGVPPERILAPPATIAAPAALQYALLGEGPDVADLREMFENLLAASMDRDTASSAHPAFVSMISQLTPEEARILKSIERDDYASVTVRARDSMGYIVGGPLGFRTTLGHALDFDASRQQRCISNLVRLGILDFSGSVVADLQKQQMILDNALAIEFGDRRLHLLSGSIQVTPLGRQFLDTCIGKRATSGDEP